MKFERFQNLNVVVAETADIKAETLPSPHSEKED